MSELQATSTRTSPSGAAGVPGEASDLSRRIFLVGCHRSGTSLLRMLIDSHPRISAGPEDPSLFWMAQLDTDLWRTTLGMYGFSEEEWLGRTRDNLEELHSRYAASQGKTRWAAKCPENSLVCAYLDKLYPDCQIVHIVRNPRDVIASNREKYGHRRGPFYGARWVTHVRAAEVYGAKLGQDRFRTIRYEDLVADPEKVLKEVVEWLGESWSDDVLRFGERTHTYPPRLKTQGENQFVMHTRSVGRGRTSDSIVPLLYVHLKARDLVKRFGY